MSIEGTQLQESFKSKFTIWDSKDDLPIPQKKLLASYDETTFEIIYNSNNYTFIGDIKMVGNTRQKESDELNLLKTQAKEAFEEHMENLKWEDYSQNFK